MDHQRRLVFSPFFDNGHAVVGHSSPTLGRMNFRVLLVVAWAITCAACAGSPRIAGGDGTSAEAAVRVIAAQTLKEQDQAMLRWIEQNVPGGRLNRSDSRYILSNRVLYAARVDTPGGGQRIVYFDISDVPRK